MIIVGIDHSLRTLLVSVNHFVCCSEISLLESLLSGAVTEKDVALHSLSKLD